MEATQDDAERHRRSRFDTGFTVQPGACLMGFVSSKLVPAHAGEAEQSMHGLKICFAAGDGTAELRKKIVPIIHMQQSDSVPAHLSPC